MVLEHIDKLNKEREALKNGNLYCWSCGGIFPEENLNIIEDNVICPICGGIAFEVD